MARILLVEDERDLREMLVFNLESAGYEVDAAEDGNGGLALFEKSRPDAVLLDLMLPGISGLDVCRKLKSNPATRDVPVIILTARGQEIDRVVGFELGADDYVVKPYSTRELLLRLQVVLRRSQNTGPPAEDNKDRLRFGALTLDIDAHRIWVDENEVNLTALEFRLLLMLFDRKDRVQTRGALLEEVWGASEDMATRTVDTHVKRLREKLGKAGDYIETVRGVGYRFLDKPV